MKDEIKSGGQATRELKPILVPEKVQRRPHFRTKIEIPTYLSRKSVSSPS